ncbi:arginine repressor [Caldisericum exile]|uniref:Arginine repressor n=1 Tax=Caldisericum exile (strain DSM 21853 / NBRC 104410 / AZM16c01) TaxID=511051 RepID=A0A7U6JEF5_CALEA|nr:arginine repressor [Caldisericum exile]BAL80403.1 arginine repressor [Caldisericum exile AZM16c01]
MNKYKKEKRQALIKEILKTYEVETEEDLVLHLKKHNIDITQPTIAKDLKELGVIKVNKGNKSYYALPEEGSESILKKIEFAFENFVREIVVEDNLILVKTTPGNANSVAWLIDKYEIKGILGTVAGDDTILVVTKRGTTKDIIKQLEDFKK